jgi:hypothetical protein
MSCSVTLPHIPPVISHAALFCVEEGGVRVRVRVIGIILYKIAKIFL